MATTQIKVPDIGADTAEVIEVLIAAGDRVELEQSIIVLESDKASMEVPADFAGIVGAVHVKVGDRLAEGAPIADIKASETAAPAPSVPAPVAETPAPVVEAVAAVIQPPQAAEPAQPRIEAPAVLAAASGTSAEVYAGPAVRRLARDLGVDLSRVSASGARGRVLKEDIEAYVKDALQGGGAPSAAGGSGVPAPQVVDWSKFGEIRTEPMSKIQRLTADNMTRCWLNVPHVTQFDDADVTHLEEYRQMLKAEGSARGIKMTPVAFLLKIITKTLAENPKFNSSLLADGQTIVYRNYCHLGLAVDTPVGLMVPVIRDADKMDIWQLASAVTEMAEKAKGGKLKPNETQGACFTISSLGAMGGRGFTPIVPTPQVGILGVSRTSIQPVWDGSAFVPRKMMPLALSYDHRAVNGGDAGRFLTRLVELLRSADNLW